MTVLLLFVDGIGLGSPDPDRNPFVRAAVPTLNGLLGGAMTAGRLGDGSPVPLAHPLGWGVATDASLGVPGLPQSASGQTAILTGVNASAAIGRHLNGHPSPSLKAILEEHSLFRRLTEAGRRATFINAYRPRFFDWLARPEAERYRPSASTVAVMAAGLPFRGFAELADGQAVYHDITHHTLVEHEGAPPPVDPYEAGRRAAVLAGSYDFALFEHFLTDMAGHSQETDRAVTVLETYDRFLAGVLEHLDLEQHLLLLTSDHGNIEDLSVKTHTINRVPTLAVGPGAREVAGSISDLTHITPAILRYLGV